MRSNHRTTYHVHFGLLNKWHSQEGGHHEDQRGEKGAGQGVGQPRMGEEARAVVPDAVDAAVLLQRHEDDGHEKRPPHPGICQQRPEAPALSRCFDRGLLKPRVRISWPPPQRCN